MVTQKKTKKKTIRSQSKGSMVRKPKSTELWVVKIGSQLIMEGGPLLIRALMQEVAYLMKYKSIKIVWVTSGAIASARQRLDYQWRSLPEKQALSALGQPMLMDLYNLALQSQGLMGAQVLLSYSDFKRKESRTHLCNTIYQLLDWNAVPLLNENDVVATDEIQFGDNDQLSAKVACELKANRLVILTHVEGLYDREPSQKGAQLVDFLPRVNQVMIREALAFQKSSLGRGGISSKLLAAQKASQAGIPTFLVRGSTDKVLTRLWQKENIGTRISGKRSLKKDFND